MSEVKYYSIGIKRDSTLPRLQRIAKFGDTYDSVIVKLLNKCEREFLEQAQEEALTATIK
jgi:hypothetical protein